MNHAILNSMETLEKHIKMYRKKHTVVLKKTLDVFEKNIGRFQKFFGCFFKNNGMFKSSIVIKVQIIED